MKIIISAFIYLGEDAGSTHLLEVWKHIIGNFPNSKLLLPQVSREMKERYYSVLPKEYFHFVPGTSRSRSQGIVREIKFSIASLWYEFYLAGYILVHRPKLLYQRSKYLSFSSILLSLFRIPYIVEMNGLTHLEQTSTSILMKISLPIHKYLEQLLVRKCAMVISVTSKLVKAIKDEYSIQHDRFSVIPNGADIEHFRPIKDSREKLQLEMPYTYLCFVGYFAPWQGIENLLRAVQPLIAPHKLKILLIGNGPIFESIKQLAIEIGIDRNCIFTGAVPYHRVPLFINAADFCVAPFIADRNNRLGLSPLKLYEYMACAKPVVVSDIEGVGDIVKKHRTGVSVEPGNIDSLRKGIVRLIESRNEWERMGSNGRTLVEKEYSWKISAQKTEVLLNRLLTSR